jgi:Kelch motif/Galactose oxidase, central domain
MLIVRSEDVPPLSSPYRGDRYEPGDELGLGIVVYNGQDEAYVDDQVQPGKTYYYEAVTFDEYPNYGNAELINATVGSMIRARLSHTQTTLADGRALIVGGVGYAGPLEEAELFDPNLGFSETSVAMRNPRFAHTATLLNDGRVLILGGYEEGFLDTLDTAELFDPESGAFEWIDQEMSVGRASHTATLLSDGSVLVVGGTDGENAYDTAEIFDPETVSFTSIAARMERSRYGHTATLVNIEGDDLVLIAGGFDGFSTVPFAVLFDPISQTFSDFLGEPETETALISGRVSHTASALNDGRVLLAGGFVGTQESGNPTETTELFLPTDLTGTVSGGPLYVARSGHAAVTLADGTVLIIGGIDASFTILESVELYDPDIDGFSAASSLTFSRTVPAASLLADGTVLVTGGNGSSLLLEPMPVSSAERFDPATGAFTVVGAIGG